MIEDLNYPDDYKEELEGELKALRISHNELVRELDAVYGSKTFRLGNLARVAYKNPLRVAKKVAKVAKDTKRISPKAFRYSRATIPHTSAVFNAAYKKWQKTFEPGSTELKLQRKHAQNLKRKPTFSIITPVFKPPYDVLVALIESVLDQTYPNFELCLGEFSGDERIRNMLNEYAAKDTRIKIKFFDDNAGISANSNHCLELATGEYIGLLDHDDLLSPNALYENALMINKKDYDFIYSDKDKIDEAGNRFDPMFKPDWSPELMLTANYLTHFNVFKRSLVIKIGGWDKITDGAQDWDLFFRLIREGKTIGHIPKILYHWRVIATSTAHSITTKPYALVGQRKAIEKYTDSLGIARPTVSHSKEGVLRLEWGSTPITNKSIQAIVFTNSDSAGQAHKLAKKLAKNRHLQKENITIYNADDPRQNLGEIIENTQAKAEHLLFISSKVESMNRSNWLEELVGWLNVPGVGIASPQVYSKFGVFLEDGRVIGLGSAATPLFAGETYIPGIFGYREWSRNVSMPSMNCFVLNSKALGGKTITQSGIQGLREVVLTSIDNGNRTVVTPFDQVVIDSATIYEPAMSAKNKELIKNVTIDLEDPYFSKNLSAKTKSPLFISGDEPKDRKKIIEEYLDQPIEYDPAVSAKRDLLYAEQETLPLVGYKRDAYILAGITDYNQKDISNSRKITDSDESIDRIESALWILPNFTTLYAGLKNIFALASELTDKENTKHTFYITTNDDTKIVEELIDSAFPNLADSKFLNANTYKKIKNSSSYTIGVCSLWTTAYELLKDNEVKRKLYIIQDDERCFYPRGTVYGLVDASYDFGFWGVAGTQALADWYKSRQGKKGKTAILGSDLELTTYLKESKKKKKKSNKVPKVLFYSRPDAPRNGFELGLHSLNKLADLMDGSVDIVLAGSEFDLSQYEGVHTSIRTAGKVPYSDLAEFYASFDAALFLMFSEHPGVFPMEMMASSVPVVINKHNNAAWKELYVNGKTCLLAEPTASSISNSLGKILSDKKLSSKLVHAGRLLAEKQADLSYKKQASDTIKLIKN